jgi:hypothetical protein
MDRNEHMASSEPVTNPVREAKQRERFRHMSREGRARVLRELALDASATYRRSHEGHKRNKARARAAQVRQQKASRKANRARK